MSARESNTSKTSKRTSSACFGADRGNRSPRRGLTLGFVGALDALYFVLVAYRWMRPDPRWLPNVCRMDEQSCARIVDTREGRLLGVPNGVIGLGYYALVMVGAGVALATGEWIACEFLLVAAALSVVMSAYLAWALLARLRVACFLCLLGHLINGFLFALLLGACTT